MFDAPTSDGATRESLCDRTFGGSGNVLVVHTDDSGRALNDVINDVETFIRSL